MNPEKVILIVILALAFGVGVHAFANVKALSAECLARGGVLVRGVGFGGYECVEPRRP